MTNGLNQAGAPAEEGGGGEGRGASALHAYAPPRLVFHGTLEELTRSGEGTNLDGGAGFAFSGAEP